MDRLQQVLAYNKPLPRYTSYPTAPFWTAVSENEYCSNLQKADGSFSCYIHIPFCSKLCYYCGCSTLAAPSCDIYGQYVQNLVQEIEQVSAQLGTKKLVQLHFGGGTPTILSHEQMEKIVATLKAHFFFDDKIEMAIEVDPRTVSVGKLALLRELGFNRVSFGVQDFDEKVQKAIGRNQTEDETLFAYEQARNLNFSSINFDLVYGLPHQSRMSFQNTIDKVLSLRPDRISLFSWARLTALKPLQRLIPEEAIPTDEEKFAIFCQSREKLIENQYIAIGMDHFAVAQDELAIAFGKKKIMRNFQGYTTDRGENLIGFGLTAISQVNGNYFQNCKELHGYSRIIKEARLPIDKGMIVTDDDLLRRFVIGELMCYLRVNKAEVEKKFGISFDVYFAEEKKALLSLKELVIDGDDIEARPLGALFIRNIASCFDSYLQKQKPFHFSQTI